IKIMKKLTFIIGLIAIGTLSLMGCSSNIKENEEPKAIVAKEVKVIIPDGLPTIAIAKLAKENITIKEGYNVEYAIESTPETLSTAIMKEEADIAIVPSNMAAIAYNKTENYQIAGTVGGGSFYLVSTENINEFEDLVDEDVWNTGKGLTPDLTVKSILTTKGINPDSINFNYVSSTNELVPLLATGKAKTGFVPEPALTALMDKNPEIKIIKGLNDTWKEINDSKSGYPQSTIIVKSSFAKENKDFIEAFLGQLSNSIDWANLNGEEAGMYAQTLGASIKPSTMNKALERANLKLIKVEDTMKDYNDYYSGLLKLDAKSLGGKMPDEGIYFVQE
ncbi:MAG: ABC transporter substrate-binding protein, partial [Romboutsia sp.]|uniref:ABC transporter substrate-binding protein n=1 Tax=Romboutsia sp. TaxID=1965302 RepID=UPI003F3FE121